IENRAAQKLESRDRLAELRAEQRQKLDGCCGAVDTDERADHITRLREKAERRACDDAERALRTNEELLHVVAGIILAQATQAIPDLAVGEHHFEAEHEAARIAIAQHLIAAGIGRNVATDLAGAFGAKAQREKAIGVGCRLLDLLEDHARI